MEILQRELVYLWYYFSVQLEQIFPYWILGMLLGSAASVFLKDRIHTVFRSLGDRKLGVLGIAASFSKSGIKDDWLAAFMITGPATKITNLGAVKIVLGLKRFLLYLAYVMVFALFTGWIANLLV